MNTDVCLCLSALPLFLETNVVAILAVTIAGKSVVTDILTNLIIGAAPNAHCVYPDHSTPICINGNPCGFQCTDGFTPYPPQYPTTCVCNAPYMVCNGQRWVGSGTCAEKGHEWTACGVFGGGARAWECVNTARDLESCGGCALPLTPYSPIGKDCTALPGVADVSCLSGQCIVHRCLPGHVPTIDGTGCVSKHMTISHPHIADPDLDNEAESMPARLYGLEHVPLQRN
ncbi:hypothetical protein B0F90DRAFT_1629408 [Multifurca ochricompacta]|uniref:Protein CPL1-like domain-containing protein n=1 Tax=Multifurca ochricompacta TaxID=376703 RepID=A0AAD4M511_9AGAM|nr:hypothetical protein B0F90DRAFT_1629408 [Multifurca ochricompacta]